MYMLRMLLSPVAKHFSISTFGQQQTNLYWPMMATSAAHSTPSSPSCLSFVGFETRSSPAVLWFVLINSLVTIISHLSLGECECMRYFNTSLAR